MKRRLVVLSILASLFVVAFGLTALGAEHEEASTTDTTVSSVSSGSSMEPAVVVKPENKLEPTPEWTYRYLVPASLVIAAVVILLTAVRYFSDVVRKRYRIVE
ncbi:MAG: hypothetical protein ACE5F5_08525 [Acidimicrobiia bacterium]